MNWAWISLSSDRSRWRNSCRTVLISSLRSAITPVSIVPCFPVRSSEFTGELKIRWGQGPELKSWPPFAGPAMTCAQRSWHSASEIRLDRGRLIAVQITLQRKGHGRNLELDAGCDRITRCIITLTALQFAAMSLLE